MSVDSSHLFAYHEYEVSAPTVWKVFKKFRKIVSRMCLQNSESRIGGPGEFDECMIGKSKFKDDI